MCFCASIWRKVYIRFLLFLHRMYWNEIQTLYAVRSRMMCLPRLRRIHFWTSWKSIQAGTTVVLVFDTDVPQTSNLKKNLELLTRYCGKLKIIFFHKFWIWRMSWLGVQTCELRWNWPKVEVLKISRQTFVKWKQRIVVPCLSVISWTIHVCGWQKRLKHLILWRIIVFKLKHYNLWCLVGKPTGYFFCPNSTA